QPYLRFFFFFTPPSPAATSTLSLHDALPILVVAGHAAGGAARWLRIGLFTVQPTDLARLATVVFLAWWLKRHPPVERGLLRGVRSEEHTSELQSRGHLVCRLLLEKKKNAAAIPGDAVSRVAAFSLTANSAEVIDTTGLVTVFEFATTPTLTNRYEQNAHILTWVAE